MPFTRIAEARINEAMARGEFDNLPGAGKPLQLDEYFSTPEDVRIGFALLRNANCAPAEVELLNEIARLESAISAATDAATQLVLRRTLADRRTHLAVLLEQRGTHKG